VQIEFLQFKEPSSPDNQPIGALEVTPESLSFECTESPFQPQNHQKKPTLLTLVETQPTTFMKGEFELRFEDVQQEALPEWQSDTSESLPAESRKTDDGKENTMEELPAEEQSVDKQSTDKQSMDEQNSDGGGDRGKDEPEDGAGRGEVCVHFPLNGSTAMENSFMVSMVTIAKKPHMQHEDATIELQSEDWSEFIDEEWLKLPHPQVDAKNQTKDANDVLYPCEGIVPPEKTPRKNIAQIPLKVQMEPQSDISLENVHVCGDDVSRETKTEANSEIDEEKDRNIMPSLLGSQTAKEEQNKSGKTSSARVPPLLEVTELDSGVGSLQPEDNTYQEGNTEHSDAITDPHVTDDEVVRPRKWCVHISASESVTPTSIMATGEEIDDKEVKKKEEGEEEEEKEEEKEEVGKLVNEKDSCQVEAPPEMQHGPPSDHPTQVRPKEELKTIILGLCISGSERTGPSNMIRVKVSPMFC